MSNSTKKTETETDSEVIKNDLAETGRLYMKVSWELSQKLKPLKVACFDPEKKLWFITKYTKLENVNNIMKLNNSLFSIGGKVYDKRGTEVITFPKYIQEDPEDIISMKDPNFKLLLQNYKNEEVLDSYKTLRAKYKPKETKNTASDFF
jgi:hypothetical protein